ncbi:hypothetical protein GCM10018980_77200 [Streptomyces capoamus]|uniref:Uncharacterized protein n=1 Tax=Streptomyces capoamus TaxID=68183 RepID=A0A919F473_9ACTN|nr:hypothetical protein GCM10018980_77200 [Streptomyces capoamus]
MARSFGQPPADPLPAAALAGFAVWIFDELDSHTHLARLLSGLP